MEGGWGPEVLAKHMSGLDFYPQYQFASHPNSRFPAALQDAVSSFNYRLKLGIPAFRITFSGDSAGGNLALALLQYAKAQRMLPYLRYSLFWSRWLDLAASRETIVIWGVILG